MHSRSQRLRLRASRVTLHLALFTAGLLPLPTPARAQNFWYVTAPPEVVLGWQPRSAEEFARGPDASRRGMLPTLLERPAAAPHAITDGDFAGWHELGPPVRAYHALVLDSRRHRFLLAGGNHVDGISGSQGLDPQGSIWSFDLASRDWREIARVPWPMSVGAAVTNAVYDSLRDRLIVGGTASGELRVDALDLAGVGGWRTIWRHPTERNYSDHALGLALDTNRNVLAITSAWDDMARFVRIPLADPGNWSSAPLPCTAGMEAGGGSMVFDAARDRFYLVLITSQGILWSLDPATAELLEPIGFPEPHYLPIRLVLDAREDRLIGMNNHGITWAVPLAGGSALKLDDRSYPEESWRYGPAFAFDPVARRLYRNGGYRYHATLPLMESVTVDSGLVATPETRYPVAGHWRAEAPLGMGSRCWPATLVDLHTRSLVVLGGAPGFGVGYTSYAMSRSLDGSGGWEPLGTGSTVEPASALGAIAILDPMRHELLSFGGQALDGTGRIVADLWRLPLAAGGTWQRVEFAGQTPAPRRYAMLFRDEPRDRFILMGGDDGSQFLHDAWELRLEPSPTWRPLVNATGPAFSYGVAFPDSLRGDAWCLARNLAFHLVLGDDAIASDESFEVFSEPHYADTVAYQFAGFDPTGRRFLLLDSPPWFRYLSFLDRARWVSLYPGHAWSEQPIAGPHPQRRWQFSTCFDPGGQSLLVVGGYDDDFTYFADAWSLVMPPMLPTPALASLLSAESDARGVRIVWRVTDAGGGRALIQRSADGAEWGDAGEGRWSAADEISFEGPPLPGGGRAAFRLVLAPGANETRTAPVWVSGPAPPGLALVPRRNPAGPDLALTLALAPGGPSRLRVFDAAGRVIANANLPAGTHEWRLAAPAPPGLYFAELVRGGERCVAKLASVR